MAVKKTKVSSVLITAVTFLILETVSLVLVYNSSYANNLFFTRMGRSVSGFFYSITSSVGGYFSLKTQNERLHAQNTELLNRYFGGGDEILRYALRASHQNDGDGIGMTEDGRGMTGGDEILRSLRSLQNDGGQSRDDEGGDEILRSLRSLQNDEGGIGMTEVGVPCTFIAAEVIGERKGSNHNYFIINKGSKDGIEPSMGVITPCGVVGIVDAVSRHVSFVVSVQSFRMNVSARIGHDGLVGPVFWSGAKTARMENIPLHYVANKGDTVYTSGFSLTFPPDIPLGTIESFSTQKGLSNALELELFEDLRALRYVTVVKSDYLEELKGI